MAFLVLALLIAVPLATVWVLDLREENRKLKGQVEYWMKLALTLDSKLYGWEADERGTSGVREVVRPEPGRLTNDDRLHKR